MDASTTQPVEPEPTPYVHQDLERLSLPLKKNPANSDDGMVVLVAKQRMAPAATPPAEKTVKIISYLGSLSDSVGQDGDFYVDEMTNILYGPKTSGVWPEEGVNAAGLCKRTWIGLTRARVAPARRNGFVRGLTAVLRFVLPFRISQRNRPAA